MTFAGKIMPRGFLNSEEPWAMNDHMLPWSTELPKASGPKGDHTWGLKVLDSKGPRGCWVSSLLNRLTGVRSVRANTTNVEVCCNVEKVRQLCYHPILPLPVLHLACLALVFILGEALQFL